MKEDSVNLKYTQLIMSFNPLVDIKDKFGLTPIEYAYFYDKLNYTHYLKVINSNLTESDIKNIKNIVDEKIRLPLFVNVIVIAVTNGVSLQAIW